MPFVYKGRAIGEYRIDLIVERAAHKRVERLYDAWGRPDKAAAWRAARAETRP